VSTDIVWPSTRPGGWGDPSAEPIPAPLQLYRTTVGEQWVDYNGHMSEWCYLLAMGNSSDAFFRYVGIDDAYRADDASLFTVETHIRNLLEVEEGEELVLSLRVLDADAKRVHLTHELHVPIDVQGVPPSLVATGEQLLVHVDTAAGRACDLDPVLQERLALVTAAHAVLPVPEWVGRPMGMRTRRS